jgi:hypothetical protein
LHAARERAPDVAAQVARRVGGRWAPKAVFHRDGRKVVSSASGEEHFMMKLGHWSLAAAVALSSLGAACSGGGAAPDHELTEQQSGQLRLPLVTPGEDVFRLRSASFVIRNAAGTQLETLSSEAAADASALSAELFPGDYTVSLAAGWFLERLRAPAPAERVNAALVTPDPAPVTIRDGAVSELVYTFTTTDGSITLGSGSVDVQVDVVQPEALTSCVLASNYYYYDSGCRAGQACLLADASGRTFCGTPGTLPVGAACDSQQCVAGAQCLAQSEGEQTVCTRFCSPLSVTFGCNCAALGFDESVGICAAPPAGACDLLEQTGCATGQACQYAGGNFGTCGAPGAAQRGDPCMGEVCAAGLDCYGDDPASGSSGRCQAFCNLEAPSCQPPGGGYDSYCESVGTGNVGRCYDYY